MHNLEKHSAILENVAGLVRWNAYILSHIKMAALGCVYTLGKQTLCSPERCTSQNATSVLLVLPTCTNTIDKSHHFE